MASASSRLNAVHRHLQPEPAAASARDHKKCDNDVVIVSAVRTAMTKGKKGGFRETHPETMLAAVLKAVVEKVNLDKAKVQDIQVGNVLPPGGGATVARMAQFYAGFPVETSVATVNRQCSSGLQACANIAGAIQAGFIDIGIGAGVEAMSLYYEDAGYGELSDEYQNNKLAADCLLPMGLTSENVASKYGVSREKQDRFSVESHKKAAAAQKNGLYEEIVPVKTQVTEKDGSTKEIVVSKDDGIRETTYEALAKLKPAFKADGSTTAGNASQVSDGAAAVLLMRRSVAKQLGLKPLARFVTFAVAGVPPDVMGVGPAFAIPKALQQSGLTIKDIDVFEINEAFASQAVYSIETLGIDYAKVNPLGGAIAIGHPLGMTGARQIATLLPELRRRRARFGVTSMCIGSGMGAASVIENEQL